jgi:23S rRNA (guanine2445-N2)-methyltransferase / 23S rRNA (guanine2069-N7)-methyltransferase
VYRFVATCAPALEELLADELRELGLGNVETGPGIVRFDGRLIDGYGACMWSRIASRILLPLRSFPVRSADELYESARGISWTDHLSPDTTFAVRFVGTDSLVRSSLFGALKVKDAIVDVIRDRCGERPSVDRDDPDVGIHAHLGRGRVTLSIDLSGPPMHLRGHERDGGPAPLKETLAAAMLRIAGWHRFGPQGAPLLDPMCGSGTLLTEAAAVLSDRAPGLSRRRWGFLRWKGHNPRDWGRVVGQARERIRSFGDVQIFGSDQDREQLKRARANIIRAGVDEAIKVRRASLVDLRAPADRGIMVTNPPYGERMQDEAAVRVTWRDLGDVLRRRFLGWTAFLLAGSRPASTSLGLKPRRRHVLFNGPLEARLLEVPISAAPVARDR